MSRARCFKWHARFKRGRTSLEDERSGRPSTINGAGIDVSLHKGTILKGILPKLKSSKYIVVYKSSLRTFCYTLVFLTFLVGCTTASCCSGNSDGNGRQIVLWQKVTPVIEGWSAGRRCKNKTGIHNCVNYYVFCVIRTVNITHN